MAEEAEQDMGGEPEQPEEEPPPPPPPQAQIPAPAAAAATQPSEQGQYEHELLAEQFNNYLNIAKSLMKTLKRPKDIEICTELMRKVERLNDSKHLEVKRNNNRFFRYCLKVLNWTSANQPLEYYQHWYNPCNATKEEPLTETRTWLEDNKSFMSLKSYKDGTSIIYAAIADNPQAGWQDGGLNILAKRSACQRN